MICFDAPLIVAKQSYVNQTASLTPVTLYTPTEVSDYIVSVYFNYVGNAYPSTSITWTDEIGEQSNSLPRYGTAVVHSIANQPISVSAALGTIPAGDYFNIVIAVIRI